MNRYFKYILLGTFVTFVLLIAFLQFNSTRSIARLINGNENLLDDITVKTTLQRLQTDILTLESKVRGLVIDGTAADTAHLDSELGDIRNTLAKLSILHSDHAIDPYLNKLNDLVEAKIQFESGVLQSYQSSGSVSAAVLVNSPRGKANTDSIKSVIQQIESLHQVRVTAAIRDADNNGRKAKAMGTVMAILAVLAALVTFAFVTTRVRQQQRLISQLDTSEKKAREAAMIKEKFLANMSHEIRTPLNAILGYTNLLQRENNQDVSKEYVQVIQRSGQNLLSIVDDVLDLSKIEAGMMRIEPIPFNMRRLVQSIETMFRTKADEKDLQLSSKISDDYPDVVEGDSTRLTQILVNLIGNAIKFTEKGTVDIRVVNLGVNGKTIQTGISVTDTGIGIAPEKLEKVFERFQQAEDSSTRKYGGTGLGLSIVNELVHLQNGKIVVASEVGKGTTFQIQIPYILSSPDLIHGNGESNMKVAGNDFSNARILVAEDNEINRDLLRHLLKEWKLEFDFAKNGREAVELIRQRKYQLVLMDIQMPELDGYAATQEIRNNLNLDTPIIAMTAHAMAGEREKWLSYGMNEYISKPLHETQLRLLIGKFIKLNEGNDKPNITESSSYSCINLQYMKEVSRGDRIYEKMVTDLFIDSIPENLQDIQNSWIKGDITSIRQIAHNMRTSISVMGLNEKLDPYLDILEHEKLTHTSFVAAFNHIKSICEKSIEEARQFLSAIA